MKTAPETHTAKRPISCFVCGKRIQPGEEYTYVQILHGSWAACCLKCADGGKS